jgi:PilZ domain
METCMRDDTRGSLEPTRPAALLARAIDSTIDQREAPRYTLLIRAAKLRCPQGEFLCVVRDASSTGVNIRLFHPLPEQDRLMLELQNGDMHELELVWQDGDRAGLRFTTEADISRIVECPSRFAKRAIRINLATQGTLSSLAATEPVTIHDISQQGAKLTSGVRFAIDQRVRLSASGLPEVNAKIRWRDGTSYGLVFEDTLQFGDLARVVAAIQGDGGGRVASQKRAAC